MGEITVRYVIDKAGQSMSHAFLHVEETNGTAYKLYEKIGFREIERMMIEYNRGPLKMVRMLLELPA